MWPVLASIINGASARIIKKGARKLVAINWSQSLTAISCKGWPWLPIPALLTKMSQRPQAERPGQGPRLRQHPRAEDDALGGGEFEAHHQPSAPGKTSVYFRAERGSAIRSATAAAQAA